MAPSQRDLPGLQGHRWHELLVGAIRSLQKITCIFSLSPSPLFPSGWMKVGGEQNYYYAEVETQQPCEYYEGYPTLPCTFQT